MKPEVLIPVGILLAATSIALAAVAFVGRAIWKRSALAKQQIRKRYSWLFDRHFHFDSPTSLFAPTVVGRLENRTNASLHFRIPGRGYLGGMGFNGVRLSLVQVTNYPTEKESEISAVLESFPGKIIYRSKSRIQWQPTDPCSDQVSLDLEELIGKLGSAV